MRRSVWISFRKDVREGSAQHSCMGIFGGLRISKLKQSYMQACHDDELAVVVSM